MNIISALETFGLSQFEIKIYLFLQNKPPQSALEISKNLNIPRTSIYDNCNKLLEKGLLEKIVLYKSQKFKAYPISILSTFIEKQQNKITKLQKNFDFLSENLPLLTNNPANTEVKYYQGIQGIKQIIWNTLKAKDEVVGYSVFGRVNVVGKTFYDKYVEEFKQKKLVDRVISSNSLETKKYIDQFVLNSNHQIAPDNLRTLSEKQLYITSDISIYNDTYSMSFWQQEEIVGVEIINPELVKTQKTIFETLWQIAKKIKSTS